MAVSSDNAPGSRARAMPFDAPEDERLAAAREAILRLRRARAAGRVPGSPDAVPARGPSPRATGTAPAAPPPSVSRVRPRAPARGPAGRVPGLARSSPRRIPPALAGAAAAAAAAAVVAGVSGFVLGRAAMPSEGESPVTARATAPVPGTAESAVPDAEEGADRAPAGTPADATAAAGERDALVADNLALQRELGALEDRAEALEALLAPERAAAIAAADRELELIDLGSADPGATRAAVEGARERVRRALLEALGRDGVEALTKARGRR